MIATRLKFTNEHSDADTHSLSPSLSGVTKTINTKELCNTKEKSYWGNGWNLVNRSPACFRSARICQGCIHQDSSCCLRSAMLIGSKRCRNSSRRTSSRCRSTCRHISQQHTHPSGFEMLKLIIAGACTRDCLRARPSWHAANPPCVFEQWQ